MGELRATMFQCIGMFDPLIFHIDRFELVPEMPEGSSVELQSEMYVSSKGSLGDKIPLEEVIGHVNADRFGSINFKLLYKGLTNISVIVFSNGRIKLSGGMSGMVKDQKSLLEYVNEVMEGLSKWLKVRVSEPGVIMCLNGICRSGRTHTAMELRDMIEMKSKNFTRIIQPDLNRRGGRRSAYKCYLLADRKLHIAYDHKGTAQIFGARSYDELSMCHMALFS